MLTPFDWLRLCKNGTELIATLHLLDEQPDVFLQETIGHPFSALHGPCKRCGIFLRISDREEKADSSKIELPDYCPACRQVRLRTARLHQAVRTSVLIWGQLSSVPTLPAIQDPLPVYYRHDEQHFLLALPRLDLQDWFSNLLLYHGLSLHGLMQIFPAIPDTQGNTIGDLLALLPAFEAAYPPDKLRVRFYPLGHMAFNSQPYERTGTLTFEARDFLGHLEMAGVFRSLLLPDQQETVFEILRMKNLQESQFHWGRLLHELPPGPRDMLLSWNMRSWSKNQLRLLDKLRPYAKYSPVH
ncbi:MAG: hypothetical protein Fur0018_03000 [Anaerolineales bacterium]